ncbi:AAA family ATPase [Candidatus Woesearchaeota archaeon]|nr:AAA family ATPase [Candidatus Woesearchaeota archaeon]
MGIFDFFRGRVEKAIEEKEGRPYIPFTVEKEEKGSYEEFYKKLKDTSLIMLIIGKRGSGKTSLGMKLLELFHKESKRKCYTIGYKTTKLPWWLKKADKIEDIPNNSIALFDEGAILFSARESMKALNKELSKVMAIARHKNLTLILITQNSAMIDLNVLRLADTLLLKEPSLLQAKFERKGLNEIFDKIKPDFDKLKEKKAHFYVWDDEFQGILKYGLPRFWSDKISKSYSNA